MMIIVFEKMIFRFFLMLMYLKNGINKNDNIHKLDHRVLFWMKEQCFSCIVFNKRVVLSLLY